MTKQARVFFLIYVAFSLIALVWSNLHTSSHRDPGAEVSEKGSNALAIVVHTT
jgi:hypothetical protein